MNGPRRSTSDARYVVNLIQAGMDGVVSARRAPGIPPVLTGPVWVPAAIGAAFGTWTAFRNNNRKSVSGIAMGGLLGSALGLGCGVAWASRAFTGALARGAMREIATVRDARWLELNPIDYA